MRRLLSWMLAVALVAGLAPAALGRDPAVISYTGRRGEELPFAAPDFEALCREATGEELEWVKFALPPERQGGLLYRPGGRGSQPAQAHMEYEPGGDPALEWVSFLPAEKWTGTTTVTFQGEGEKGGQFTGRVEITPDPYAGDLFYTLSEGEGRLSPADLDAICRATTGQGLDYIRVRQPDQGILWQDYGGEGKKRAPASQAYYMEGNPGIDRLTYVQGAGSGMGVMEYVAYSTGDRSFEGAIRIQGEYSGGVISVQGVKGQPVELPAENMELPLRNLAGEGWTGLKLTPPDPTQGNLYWNYGTERQEKVTGGETWTLYGERSLEDVTLVPAPRWSLPVNIPFSVETKKGKTVHGAISVRFGELGTLKSLSLEGGSTPIPITGPQLDKILGELGEVGPLRVNFDLPDESLGRLWKDYRIPTGHSGGALAQGESLGSATVSFVPRAGAGGQVTLRYQAWDRYGNLYPGAVVVSLTPQTTSGQFQDMERAAWAVPAAEFLLELGVVQGTTETTFGPGEPMGRGDFVLMLARAYGLTEGQDSPESFADVPQDSYYALAIAGAKAKGIVQGVDGKFHPGQPITRQEAALLFLRTWEALGRELPPAQGALEAFRDGNEVAAEAVDAVSAMVGAGVLQGDGAGWLNPWGALTRGELAVLLHRLLTQ